MYRSFAAAKLAVDVHIQSKETCLQNCGAGPSTEFCCFANKNELMAPHAVKRSVCFGSFWCGSPISRYRREGVVVKLVFKHEANRAGNTSESDVYDLTEEEMQSMLERDRILRAVDARCSPEELAFRHPLYCRMSGISKNGMLMLTIGLIVRQVP